MFIKIRGDLVEVYCDDDHGSISDRVNVDWGIVIVPPTIVVLTAEIFVKCHFGSKEGVERGIFEAF